MVAEIPAPQHRLAHNRAGANLLSGVASTLLAAAMDLGLFEVDEAALPEVISGFAHGSLPWGTCFVTSSTATASSSTSPSGGGGRSATWIRLPGWSRTPTIRRSATSRASGAGGSSSGSTTRVTPPHAPARGRLEVVPRLRNATSTRLPTSGTSDYRCPACGHARPQPNVVAREPELDGLDGVRFQLVTPDGTRPVSVPLPGLYNVYNALAAASTALALETSLDDVVAGLERFSAAFGRFERIQIGDRMPSFCW